MWLGRICHADGGECKGGGGGRARLGVCGLGLSEFLPFEWDFGIFL